MGRDLVVICLDSVRKDVFDEVATRTQELADISFDSCRAGSSWSAPSHASMISGELPHEHHVTTHSRSFDSLPPERTVFDSLNEYRKVGISGNIYAGPSYGFDHYFDEFFTLDRGTRFPEALEPKSDTHGLSIRGIGSYLYDCLWNRHTLKSVLNGVTGAISSRSMGLAGLVDEGARPGLRLARRKLQNSSEPVFAFLNLMEGHIPYRPAQYLDANLYQGVPDGWSSAEKGVWELIRNEYDERYWNWRNQLYRATVDYLDRSISEFARAIDEETVIIVTADHGDNLGTETDEGLANHKSSLSEGVLHVPLYILNAPETDTQTGQYVSHLELPAIIKGCASGHIPDVARDQIFAELGGLSAGPDPCEDSEYYDRALRCAYSDDSKIVWDSVGDCFRYELDPRRTNWQKCTGTQDHPPSWALERFNNGISTFKQKAIDAEEQIAIDSSTANRLEELGYL